MHTVCLLSLGCKALCIVMIFLVLSSICLSSSLVHFKNGTAAEFGFKKSSCFSDELFWVLGRVDISGYLTLSASIIPVYFVLFKCSDAFLIWQFYFFRCLSFLTFHNQHGTFSHAKFHSYILAVYSYYCIKICPFFK